MWSLGCILFEMLHLKPAFRARDMDTLAEKVKRGFYGKIDKDFSQEFSTILNVLLRINPFERYSRVRLIAWLLIVYCYFLLWSMMLWNSFLKQIKHSKF